VIRRTPLKVLAAGSAIALAGGVAVASAMPDAASDGLGTASENAGFEVPASENADAAQLEGSEATEEVEEIDEVEEVEGLGQDNHGAVVSEFAETTELTGSERGAAIAEVAQGDEGKPEQASEAGAPAEAGAPEGAGDAGAERAAAGADNGGGRP
jgi:alpha-D-ribose 1-methylphosphonate 5-phosphate C-P lyase